jgi:hypothetical protein
MEILAKYGEVQTFYFPLVDRGTLDFESTPVTFAAADIQVSIDGGAFANANATPSHEGNGIYSWTCTAAETQGTRIVVTIIDSATKLWEDQCLILETQLSGVISGSDGIQVLEVNNDTFTATTTALEATMISPTTTEETVSSIFIGKLISWRQGAAAYGEITDVTASELANSKVKLTYTAIVSTPAAGDKLVVM